jgi:hypothetical protein
VESTGLWAAPLLLIPGVGLLVLSTSARFGQLHQELLRQQSEGRSRAVTHLRQRARLLHSALVSFYVSVAVINFAAIQLIRESKLLITVILDDPEREPTSQ